MKSNIEIDDKLIAKAQKLTGITDKNLLIEKALLLFVSIEDQKYLVNLNGKIELDYEAYK